MTESDHFQQVIQSLKGLSNEKKLPPVESWDPDHCGEMDLVIKANGDWLHEGSKINRQPLVNLFSSVLKKENEAYFLVTPVEKIMIQVEWQPFVITDFNRLTQDGLDYIQFVDQCGNITNLTHQVQLKFADYQSQCLPIVNVRRNLFASFTRACYYRLLEAAQLREQSGREQLIIASAGKEFVIGEYGNGELGVD